MSTLRSGDGSSATTLFCTCTVKANSTATMIVGTTVKMISIGRLYCVCRGGTSESPARLRWKIIAQNIAPQVITPTTSAAMQDQVQNSRMSVAWGVTPTGQPNRRASSTEHPVMSGTASRGQRREPRRPPEPAAVPPALCSAHCSRSLDSSHSLGYHPSPVPRGGRRPRSRRTFYGLSGE